MATSVDINIITGRTGTAHVSSDDDASIWRGLVGSGDVTLTTDDDLELDYSTKGSLVLSTGVFCMNGRMGRIDSPTTVTYNLPLSKFQRTILLVRYELRTVTNSNTQEEETVEAMTLMTLQSEAAEDASTAAGLPIASVLATDYILYDFVCDKDGVVGGTMKNEMNVINAIPALNALYTLLNGRVSSVESNLTNEATARANADTNEATQRANADTALGNRITPLETWRNQEDSSTYKLVRVIAPNGSESTGCDYVICKNQKYAFKSMFYWSNYQYEAYYYSIYLNGDHVSVTFYELRSNITLVAVAGGSATVLGSVKFVGA